MIDVGTLRGTVALEDRFSTALETVASKASNTLGKVGSAFTNAGRSLSLGITAPILAAGTASTVMSATFEASMTRLVSLAGVSAGELDLVKKKVLEMGPAVGIGPQALATAMTKVSSTVSDTKVALEILEMAAKGSAAGLGEAVEVAGAITAVVNSYGKENITAARAADVLTQAVKDGGAEARELAPTLANVVPIAAQIGVSFEEVAANIATLTKLGVPATEAVTSLTSVFTALLKETNQGQEALSRVGMNFGQLRAEVREKGLGAALTELLEKFGDNKEMITDVFGRVEAVKNIMGTAGQQAATYAHEIQAMTGAVGTADAAFRAMQGTQTHTWGQVTSALQVAAIRFGDGLAPAMMTALEAAKPLLDVTIKLADQFANLPQPVQTSVIGMLGFAAALGPTMFIVGSLINGVRDLIPFLKVLTSTLFGLTFPIRLLSSQIEIFGIKTGIATTAQYLFHTATVTVTGACKTLWAVVAAHPFVALAAAIGAATLAYTAWRERTEALKLSQEEQAARQDSINLAVERGARSSIKYSEAVAFNEAWLQRLKDPMTAVNDRLTVMANNGALATEKLDVMSAAALKLSSEGRLGATQMEQFAEKIRGLGVPIEQLPPALQNIVLAMERMKASGAGAASATLNIVSTEAAERAKEYAEALADVNFVIQEAKRDIGNLTEAQKKQVFELQRLGLSNDQIATKLGISTKAVDKFVEGHDSMLEGLRNTNLEMKPLEQSVGHVGTQVIFLNEAFVTSKIGTKIFAGGIFDAQAALDSMGNSIENVRAEYKAFLDSFKDQGPEIPTDLPLSFGKSMMADLERVPQMIAAGLTGGGGLKGAAEGVGSMVGSTIGKKIGSTISTLGSLGGPIGAAIGSLAGPLIGKLFSIGGPSKKELEGREVVKDFEKSFGGGGKMIESVTAAYLKVGRTAAEASKDIEAMWAAEKRGPEATEAARSKILEVFEEQEELLEAQKARLSDINTGVNDVVSAFRNAGSRIPESMLESVRTLMEMNDLTAEQKELLQGVLDSAEPNYEALTREAEGYGITLDGLGPKFQQMDTYAESKKLYDFFDRAKAAGGDVGGILAGLSDEISTLVQNSLKFGTVIPDNMQPLIANLIAAGKLTDANGTKITDITKLDFGETPIDKSMKNLNTTIERLAKVLESIPGVARDVAGQIPPNPFADWAPPGMPDVPNYPNENPQDGGQGQAWPQAKGSVGRTNGPTFFYSAGKEDFAFSGENTSFRDAIKNTAGGSGGGGTVVIEIDRRRIAELVVPELPGAMERYGLGR